MRCSVWVAMDENPKGTRPQNIGPHSLQPLSPTVSLYLHLLASIDKVWCGMDRYWQGVWGGGNGLWLNSASRVPLLRASLPPMAPPLALVQCGAKARVQRDRRDGAQTVDNNITPLQSLTIALFRWPLLRKVAVIVSIPALFLYYSVVNLVM